MKVGLWLCYGYFANNTFGIMKFYFKIPAFSSSDGWIMLWLYILLQLLQIFMAMLHNKEGQLQILKPFLHFYDIAYRRTFGTTILGIAGQL